METDNLPAEDTRPYWRRSSLGRWQADNRAVIQHTVELIDAGEREQAVALVRHWPAADIAELLTHLSLPDARSLHGWLPPPIAAAVLGAIHPRLREVLLEQAEPERICELLPHVREAERVAVLRDLPEPLREELLPRLEDGEALRGELAFGEESAGGIMLRDLVSAPPDWTIGQAIGEIRRQAPGLGDLHCVYVVDAAHQLLGMVRVHELLLNASDTRLGDIMHTGPVCVHADMDREEVARLAEHHELVALPVVDAGGRVIGRITADQLQDVIREEAEEDIKLMSGVSPDSNPDESLRRMIRGRLPWLLGGLVGAGIAGMVVGSFEEQLARAAILATFIPIVMAMAGNAGIQASTITVRGLALGTLWYGDLGRRFGKEVTSALINGTVVSLVLCALIVALGPLLGLEQPLRLGAAAGISLIGVIVMASSLGATVPLLLHRLGIDPAMATGVFVTTANDILGVLIFFAVVSAVYFV